MWLNKLWIIGLKPVFARWPVMTGNLVAMLVAIGLSGLFGYHPLRAASPLFRTAAMLATFFFARLWRRSGVLTDLEFTGAQIPPQQVPFFDGCEPLLATDPAYFGDWMAYAMTAESFHASEVVEAMTWYDLSPEEEAAYDAPFPSREYMAGPRVFPSLANQLGGNTEEAWNGLTSFEKPFLTLWASNDPGNLGSCETQQQLIDNIPGAAGQPHDRLAPARSAHTWPEPARLRGESGALSPLSTENA